MSPQFVDFDGDGNLDIVAGIFDGSPHLARGSAKGWRQPEQILDEAGERIVMNDYWDFDEKQWVKTNRCDPEGAELPLGHITSAWAADMDGDGDFDLLLGDHKSGLVLLRRNVGTRERPAFATRNEPVLAGGAQLAVPGTVATLRLFDLDGDGAQDLLVGTMGDAYGAGPGGGVFVHRNEGSDASPRYAAATTLLAASTKGQAEPTRPDAGLYMDVADVDADGDVDLVVGAYSMWTPPAPQLDEAQRQRVQELQRQLADLDATMQAYFAELTKATEGLDDEAAAQKRKEIGAAHRDELQTTSKQRAALQRELDPLVPGSKRQSFVWLYENVGTATPGR